MYYSLYRAAWRESEARAAEMEAAEKKEKEEVIRGSRSTQNATLNKKPSQEEILNKLHGMGTSGDIDDLVDELM